MNIIVGSTAYNYHMGRDQTGDLDIWTCNNEHDLEGDICIVPESIMMLFSEESKISGYATLPDLLAIKLSHLEYDIFWCKHLSSLLDINKHTTHYNEELYQTLRGYWAKEHSKERLSLYKTRDEFFDDFVVKIFDHDWLHEQVAIPNHPPVYSTCLVDGQEVLIDKKKFDLLPFNMKIRMFREEIAVIAIERYLAPSKFKIDYSVAWKRALHKTVTNLTKNWASQFIVQNIELYLEPICLDHVWPHIGYDKTKETTISDITGIRGIETISDLRDNGLRVEANKRTSNPLEFFLVVEANDKLYKADYVDYTNKATPHIESLRFKEAKLKFKTVTEFV